MSNELMAAIGRLRRAMPRNADAMLVCDAAEHGMGTSHAKDPNDPVKKRAPNGTFDRTAYQRNLMRKRRAAERLAPAK